MTKIKLRGELDIDLVRLGLKEGDEVNAEISNEKSGAAYFSVFYTITVDCVVWPENYEIC